VRYRQFDNGVGGQTMRDGKYNLAEAVAVWLLAEGPLSGGSASLMRGCESPIEELLVRAVDIYTSLGGFGYRIGYEPLEKFSCGFNVQFQHNIDKYRVDFLFSIISVSGKTHRLVVECDGHDFHERTKEQAIRDRSKDRRIQELGYKIFRFTGSEIYNKSFECARQICRWAEDALFDMESVS
jgi:very-short-patch-repair endonuclease